MEKLSDPWIFVSHANADIQAVRRVRNELERRNAHPILFYLKQRVDNALLWQLIRSEIEERRFFLLCDSRAARDSRYVQCEVEIVKSLPRKRYLEISLDAPTNEQDLGITRLLRDATVFLSYAHRDVDKVRVFADALAECDFRVWNDEQDLQPGMNFQDTIQASIKSAVAQGFFLLFVSQASVSSQWVQREVDVFLQMQSSTSANGRLVPVMLEPVSLVAWPPAVSMWQWFDATSGDISVNAQRLVDHMTKF